MANRVVVGDVGGNDVFRVSTPGNNVLTATGDDLQFDSSALGYVNSLISGETTLNVNYSSPVTLNGTQARYSANGPIVGSWINYNSGGSNLGTIPHILFGMKFGVSTSIVEYFPNSISLLANFSSSKAGVTRHYIRPVYVEAQRNRFRFICEDHNAVFTYTGTPISSFNRNYPIIYNVLAIGGDT